MEHLNIKLHCIVFYNIALGKRAFWLANILDPFARGLHAQSVCLFVPSVEQKQQQTSLLQPYEVSNA